MRFALRLIALLGASAAACSGTQWDGVTFRNDELAFRFGPTPESWRKLEVDGTLLAFRDDADAATIALSGRCGLDGDDVPLTALTHHLFLQFTDRELASQKTVELDGREALRSELSAKLDGVPKHFVIYVLKKDGCVYDFMHIAPPSAPPNASFEQMVRTFHTVRP